MGEESVPLVLQPIQQGLPVAILAQSPEIIAGPRLDLALAISKQHLGSQEPQPTGSSHRRPIATSHQLYPVG